MDSLFGFLYLPLVKSMTVFNILEGPSWKGREGRIFCRGEYISLLGLIPREAYSQVQKAKQTKTKQRTTKTGFDVYMILSPGCKYTDIVNQSLQSNRKWFSLKEFSSVRNIYTPMQFI